MKSNIILDKLDQTIQHLQTGVDIDFGEVRLIWELAYTQTQEYFTEIKKNKLEVGEEGLEMLAKLNELVMAYFIRFPKKNSTSNPIPIPLSIPYTGGTIYADPNRGPYLMPRKDGTGWEWNTGTNLPPITHTYSTSTGE